MSQMQSGSSAVRLQAIQLPAAAALLTSRDVSTLLFGAGGGTGLAHKGLSSSCVQSGND